MRKIKRFCIAAAVIALCSGCAHSDVTPPQATDEPVKKITVFLDAGHGKPSNTMSDEEKRACGWIQKDDGRWGEWRHWRDGQYGIDCEKNDGAGFAQPKDCWYPIENGNRDTELEINLQNCLSAKTHLEEMGYEVILSRKTNDENPSITKRIDDAVNSGADFYVCVHSNAGGGKGTAYIAMDESDSYYAMHRGNNGEFAKNCNQLGKIINDKIAENTSLDIHGNGCLDFEPYLILFQKSPITTAYLEIGFFDNESDMAILSAEHDKIGRSIAEGIDEYCALRVN